MIHRARRHLLLLALVAGPLGSGCADSGDDPPQEGPRSASVEHRPRVHLDPRLADGRAPGELLSTGEVIVRRFTVGSSETATRDLAPWVGDNLLFHPIAAGTGVRAADYRPADGVVHAALEFAEPLLAATVNRIELDLVSFRNGNATLTWETDDRPVSVPLGSLRVDAVTTAGDPQTIALSLVGHPAWRGTIRRLRLFPCWKGAQSYELREVRFLRDNFDPGPDPSSAFGGDGGDSGLMGAGVDKRRAWPSDHGVSLYADLDVDHGQHLVVDVALMGEELSSTQPAHFAVDVRHSPEGEPPGPWQRVASQVLPPGPKRSGAWRTLRGDLSSSLGQPAELRLRTWRGTDEPTPGEGELIGGAFLWGSPVVFGERGEDPRPDLILVTLDTLRADALGCYGGPSDTPFLDSLAAEGIRFEEALSACNSTLPAHTSILTGLPVPTHGVLDNRSTLAPAVRTLAQSLREAGYTTAAAVSVEHLQPAWSGLGRGFDQFLEVAPGATVNGALTLDGVERWLDAWAEGPRRPLFLWVHLFDPHTPYGPPRSFLKSFEAQLAQKGQAPPSRDADPPSIGRTTATRKGEFLYGVTNRSYAQYLYRAGAAYTDHLVERLVGSLDRAGLWSGALAVITADHGESLGEQDVWYNHQRIHPEVMRVPLILHLPNEHVGLVSRARSSTADIARTFMGLARGQGMEPGGVDLLHLAQDEDARQRRVWFVHSNQAQAGCRDGDVHYFHNLTEYLQLGPERAEAQGLDFLYRHGPDPGSAHNLAEVEPELAARYQIAMRAWLEQARGGVHMRANLSPEEEARMRGLGYGGADGDGEQ